MPDPVVPAVPCQDPKPRIGSLCSGYDGLAIGLQAVVGGDVVWQSEIDPHATLILAERFPGVPNLGDLTTVDWSQVKPVDWLTAGYPCQPFSPAGKRKGVDDPRHIWPSIARAVSVLRPRHLLLENVSGHLRLGFDRVLADLAGLGYDASWGLVRASDVGAPHRRERLFVLAADTCRERYGCREDGRGVGRLDDEDEGEACERQRSREVAGDRSAATVADTNCGSFAGVAVVGDGLPVTTERGDGPAPDTECGGRHWRSPDSERSQVKRTASSGCSEVDWGVYGPAIQRWGHRLGRAAPAPTEPGSRGGQRLAPRFVEWMMGLPAGWVTDVPIPRNAQLKALGNGCVPQQVEQACRSLLAVS